MIADVRASLRQPVSDEAVRRGRVAVGALALGGAAAVLFGWGNTADAATQAKTQPIRTGDNLSTIAAKHKVSVAALAAANNMSVNDVIYSGKSLTIPTTGTERSIPPAQTVGTYSVKRGDNLSTIAASQKVSVAALAAANNMSTKSILSIGRTLSIPGAVDSSPAASTAPKSKNSKSKSGNVPSDMPANDPRWKLRSQFKASAKAHGVSESLLEAMTYNESGWNNNVVSGVGARGIGQIMPDTAKHINEMAGKKLDVNKPADNIEMSAIYLRHLMDSCNGDYKLALASYYQGLGSVRSIGMYEDTKQYVATITALQKNYF
jgi:soluble lytic murein transglycosylase-like protein